MVFCGHQQMCPGWSQINKFEQVSSDHHQMSVAGWRVLVSRSEAQEMDTLPYDLSHDSFKVTYLTPPVDRQIHICVNITFS